VVASWNLPEVEPRTGLAPGARFDHYELRAALGAGGMGAVFRAHDESLGRDVAIKILNPFWVACSGKTHSAAVHDLRTEARTLARLRHPNVVTVYTVGEVDGRPYLAMELVEGPTLAQWHETSPSRRATAEVWAAIGRGLMAAHDAGIVHRDFKPDNVIIDDDGQPRLLDFGLAAPASPSEPSLAAGTLRYAAPEQLSGEPVDARADQFSFCTALHEVVFGHHPRDPEQRPRLHFPSRLRAAILRGLEEEPARRHATMQPLVEALRAVSTRGRLVSTVSAGIVGAGLMVALSWGEGPCPSDPTRLESSSNTEHSAWVDRWNAAHRQACLDTRVRGIVDSGTYRARLSCLEDLAEQYEAHVMTGPWSVAHLSGPRRCLRSTDGVDSGDPHLASRLEQVRAHYMQLEFAELQREGLALAHEARRRGELRIAASALKLVASGQLWHGRVDEADETLRQAQDVARQARAEVLEARLWISRAELEGLHREQPGVALGMLEVAESLLARADATSSLHRVHLLEVRGMIHSQHRRRTEATAALDEAIQLVEHLEGPAAPQLPQLLVALGGVWADPGDGQDLTRAESFLQDALQLIGSEPDGGGDDLARIRLLNNLAAVEHQRANFPAAIDWMRQALTLVSEVSEDPLDTALLEANLASTLAEIPERAVEAEQLARSSIATFSAQRGPDTYLLSTARLALAHALIQQDQCPQALVVLDRLAMTLPFDPSNHDRIRVDELRSACDAR